MNSTIYYPNGRSEILPAAIAYAVWLATPCTVLRVAGDNRPVMRWEFTR